MLTWNLKRLLKVEVVLQTDANITTLRQLRLLMLVSYELSESELPATHVTSKLLCTPLLRFSSLRLCSWVVDKIMVPFGVLYYNTAPNYLGYPKRDLNFDNHPAGSPHLWSLSPPESRTQNQEHHRQ